MNEEYESPETGSNDEDDAGDDGLAEALMGGASPTDVFLQMRAQNIELLQLAARIAGHGNAPGPLKPHELQAALKSVWNVYSEIYEWIDPEELEDEEEDEDGDYEDER